MGLLKQCARSTLSQLCYQGLIFCEGDRYLALALRRRAPLSRNKG